MKAVAIYPGQPKSAHLTDIPEPTLDQVPDGRGVLVRVVQVGVDGTDKEIYLCKYGRPPVDAAELVTGHEALGIVEAVGPNVWEFKPGDYVVPTVRRPGHSLYDQIGYQDMTTDAVYFERGINLLNGYMAERFVDSADFMVLMPPGLCHVGVLLEPLTIAEKGIAQAYEIQRRMHLWRPRTAAVTGVGPLGLLAVLVLRLRGLQVTAFGLDKERTLNVELVEALGATYHASTPEEGLLASSQKVNGYDIVFEATGFSPMAFEGMQAVARDGVLVLASVTGGDRTATVPTDKINLEFVLGNKVCVGTVNAAREYFEAGVSDLALTKVMFPGWLERFMTHPVDGIENFQQLYDFLMQPSGVMKAYLNVDPSAVVAHPAQAVAAHA